MGKCRSCGLVQVVPMPNAKEIAGLYHEDLDHFEPYIDQLSVHHAYFKQKIKEISDQLPITNNQSRILDIGCAMGVLLEEAQDAGMKATGIDLSKDAATYCRKHGLTAYFGTVNSRPGLERGGFDVVTAFQIVEHERDPLTMMKKIRSLLKPDGLVVMATPNYGGFWRKLMGRRWFGFAHPEHVVLFDHQTMRLLLEKAGFHDIEVKNDTPRPFPLSFVFTRGADYFPWAAWILKPLGKFLDQFQLVNPINPWDDMIVFAHA
jgi:2-polyprenyl-3-methyl-5-hydroxy-6-metoxy-1,4-benzoquinol methylase